MKLSSIGFLILLLISAMSPFVVASTGKVTHSVNCLPDCTYVKFHVYYNNGTTTPVSGAVALIGYNGDNNDSVGLTNHRGIVTLPAYPKTHAFLEVAWIGYGGHECEVFGGINTRGINQTKNINITLFGC